MHIFLTVLHVTVCLSLIAIILLQVGKGHGLSGASFGSGGAQSIFGTKAGTVLSKATTVVAIVFILTTISLDVYQAQKSRSLFQAQQGVEEFDMEAMKAALEQIKGEAQEREVKARKVQEDLAKKEQIEKAARAANPQKPSSEN